MARHLFVCSANKDRSKTAEDHFSETRPEHTFQSAGTNLQLCHRLGTEALTADHLAWADHVWVMESKHQKFIQSIAAPADRGKVTVLGIRDVYGYMDGALIAVLEEKVGGRL